MRFIILVTLICFSLSVEAISFSKAKTKMYKEVFNNSGTTFYCGCEWSNRKTQLSTCGLEGYFPKKERKRAGRTEAEHIIPASWLLKVNKKYRQCVLDSKNSKDSKRDYCRKHDSNYKKAHNDLVNLYPAVGQINADRSNKPFLNEVKIKKEGYGQCSAVSGKRGFVPPGNRKGDIARVAFYMSKTYGVVYSKRQQKLFNEWDRLDPVSEEERKHNARIIKVQGFGITQSSFDEDAFKYPLNNAMQSRVNEEKKSTSETCGNKRYCGQMSNCSEARYYLNKCGLTKLDRDKDGIPCESLCK